MPLGEIGGELVTGLVRLLGQLFVELLFELALKGPGYFIARLFNPRADPDGWQSIVLGLLLWVLIGAIGYTAYRTLA